jgi:hypothetical protein
MYVCIQNRKNNKTEKIQEDTKHKRERKKVGTVLNNDADDPDSIPKYILYFIKHNIYNGFTYHKV